MAGVIAMTKGRFTEEAINTKQSNSSRLGRKVFQVEDIGGGFFRHLVRQRVVYVRVPGSQ